jgi:hypothetical protein
MICPHAQAGHVSREKIPKSISIIIIIIIIITNYLLQLGFHPVAVVLH